jgi:activator of HSP90 ATPase
MPSVPRRRPASVKTIRQRVLLPATPGEVYEAIVDLRIHAAFTAAAATGSRRVGGRFSACDGYITGFHRELVPGERIVQDWTTTEWPEGAPPSRLELTLKRAGRATELRMVHSNVPASQAAGYRQGWIDYYWTPLKAYFRERAERNAKKPAPAPGRRTPARSKKR